HTPATPTVYTLSLHDALPISLFRRAGLRFQHLRQADAQPAASGRVISRGPSDEARPPPIYSETSIGSPGPPLRSRERVPRPGYLDRKSTRLNSSHVKISYAVF